MTRKKLLTDLLQDSGFMLRVRAAVVVHRLKPHQVTGYVTEHIMTDADQYDELSGIIEFITAMRQLGKPND